MLSREFKLVFKLVGLVVKYLLHHLGGLEPQINMV